MPPSNLHHVPAEARSGRPSILGGDQATGGRPVTKILIGSLRTRVRQPHRGAITNRQFSIGHRHVARPSQGCDGAKRISESVLCTGPMMLPPADVLEQTGTAIWSDLFATLNSSALERGIEDLGLGHAAPRGRHNRAGRRRSSDRRRLSPDRAWDRQFILSGEHRRPRKAIICQGSGSRGATPQPVLEP